MLRYNSRTNLIAHILNFWKAIYFLMSFYWCEHNFKVVQVIGTAWYSNWIIFAEHLSEHHNANNTIAPPFAQVNGISGGERKIPPNGLVNNFNASDIVEIQQHNFSVRSAVYRAVKKPGRSEYFILSYWIAFIKMSARLQKKRYQPVVSIPNVSSHLHWFRFQW